MAQIDQQKIQQVKQRFGIVGHSPVLNHALHVAIQVAPTDMTVLITGESGSGKESFSKVIHNLSYRKHNSFIAINCGAIPEGTIDSELFGHEKGAFTGAHEGRKGYFEVTDGGTIFLDEIGEMPTSTQSRLLRVLENGEFIKVGSSKVLSTDVRVVAATNVNLLEAVQKGEFREDLYYRLNTVPIYVPPLRERGEDIHLLFRKFASDYAEAYGGSPIVLSEAAKEELKNYPFPGNIRQLKNIVDQISLLEQDRKIDEVQLRNYLPRIPSNLPALVSKPRESSTEEADRSGNHLGIKEKEVIYKLLFELRHDVDELKKMIFEIVRDQRFDTTILDDHKGLFQHMEDTAYQESEVQPLLLNTYQDEEHPSTVRPSSETAQESKRPRNLPDEEEENDLIHTAEEADEVLSLETLEKEAIIKALKKHKNKRKHAAKDLGISERTLYRKIKQYDLD